MLFPKMPEGLSAPQKHTRTNRKKKKMGGRLEGRKLSPNIDGIFSNVLDEHNGYCQLIFRS